MKADFLGLGGSVMDRYMLGGAISFWVVVILSFIDLLNLLFFVLFTLIVVYLSIKVTWQKRKLKIEEEGKHNEGVEESKKEEVLVVEKAKD